MENKLTEKGISKQFVFSKVVDMFINDKLSFDNNVIASSDSKQIIIDSNEVAETIKKQYLNDLAKLISTDSNLIALVTKRLESNVISHSENDNNVITDGSNGENDVEDEPENLKRKSIRK